MRLLPEEAADGVIGVRMPTLRKLAKEIEKQGTADYLLRKLPHQYYEENQLHSILLTTMKDYDRCMEEVERFVVHIDNWGTCDTLRPRCFKKHREEVLRHIYRWMESEHEYTVRFGIGLLEAFYLDEAFEEEQMERVVAIRREEYYIRMMQAWYMATAIAKQKEAAMRTMNRREMDEWVWRKTIQKATESYRIDDDTKQMLRLLKTNCNKRRDAIQ